MNLFDEKLAVNRLTLKRGSLRTLQINLGRKLQLLKRKS
jgi:hypothetical protein